MGWQTRAGGVGEGDAIQLDGVEPVEDVVVEGEVMEGRQGGGEEVVGADAGGKGALCDGEAGEVGTAREACAEGEDDFVQSEGVEV